MSPTRKQQQHDSRSRRRCQTLSDQSRRGPRALKTTTMMTTTARQPFGPGAPGIGVQVLLYQKPDVKHRSVPPRSAAYVFQAGGWPLWEDGVSQWVGSCRCSERLTTRANLGESARWIGGLGAFGQHADPPSDPALGTGRQFQLKPSRGSVQGGWRGGRGVFDRAVARLLHLANEAR